LDGKNSGSEAWKHYREGSFQAAEITFNGQNMGELTVTTRGGETFKVKVKRVGGRIVEL
jgi:hypothetical protein